MKRFQSLQSTSRLSRNGPNAKSEMSRSMMDLSVHNTDSSDEKVPVPRFKHSVSVQIGLKYPHSCWHLRHYIVQRCLTIHV